MGTVLAPCWQRVGTVSGTVLFWYRIGTVLAPYLHRVGTVFGTVLAPYWHRVSTVFAPCLNRVWHRICTMLAPCLHRICTVLAHSKVLCDGHVESMYKKCPKAWVDHTVRGYISTKYGKTQKAATQSMRSAKDWLFGKFVFIYFETIVDFEFVCWINCN